MRRQGPAIVVAQEPQDVNLDGLRAKHAADTTFTRTIEGTIIAWPLAMELRYGFTSDQAIGKKSYQLLRTIFPGSRADIEATLAREFSWHGGLIHRHANGNSLVVMGHWVLRQVGNGADDAIVEESHVGIVSVELADLLATLANELSQPLTAISNYVNGAQQILEKERPDQEMALKAMANAGDLIVRCAAHVKLLRNLSDDLRGTGAPAHPHN